VPRLQIKIKQPEMLESEDITKYQDRINNYFDNTVKEFAEIQPDDNFYTWDDVEIKVVGAETHQGGSDSTWRLNHSIAVEEVVTAMHLYPWALGKTFQTTKNWVQSQFDLMVSQVESVQKAAIRFIGWIVNTELSLKGIHDVSINISFDPRRDPSFKDIAWAEGQLTQDVIRKIRNGIISPDQGARELGYDKAYNPEAITTQQEIEESKIIRLA
jgi:hypothetical protein